MDEIRTHYHSYLLRLWLEKAGGRQTWRASLEDTHAGERQGFPSLEALFAFLLEKTGPLLPAENDLDQPSASSNP